MTFTRHYPHWPPGVPKTLSVPRTSLVFNLEVSARRYPDKAALVYYGTSVSYAEQAMRAGLILLLFAALPAWAQVSIEQPWSRATPPGSKIGVGFMRLRNAGSAAERVVGASSPLAGRVEMHVTTRAGDVMKMRRVESFEIPAGGGFELKPGGAHLMLMDLKRPLREGERVPLVLRLERGGELRMALPVAPLGARQPAHRH